MYKSLHQQKTKGFKSCQVIKINWICNLIAKRSRMKYAAKKKTLSFDEIPLINRYGMTFPLNLPPSYTKCFKTFVNFNFVVCKQPLCLCY